MGDGTLGVASLPESFDADLQTFYHKVLQSEMGGLDPAHIRNALKEVTHAYKKGTVDSRESSIRFDTPEKRCAYVMKHCPCFTGAVAKHFCRLLRQNPTALREAVHARRQVNLCCLGGGPATEAVGVAWVVNALNEDTLVRKADKLRLRIRVVDLSSEWRTTARRVVETLREDEDFCNPRKIDMLDLEFKAADLTKPWKQSVREWLSEADIVTTVYFVSAVNGSNEGNKCLQMLQNIMGVLKPGALFFFLDSAKDLHLETVSRAAGPSTDLRLAYGPHLQIFHTLSMDSIRRFVDLYLGTFGALFCLTHCFVTCCGWVKERRTDDMLSTTVLSKTSGADNTLEEHTSMTHSGGLLLQKKKGRRWEKKMARNTERMERFRERVERLLMAELDMDFETEDLTEPEYLHEPDEGPLGGEGSRVFNAAKAKRKRIYTWPE